MLGQLVEVLDSFPFYDYLTLSISICHWVSLDTKTKENKQTNEQKQKSGKRKKDKVSWTGSKYLEKYLEYSSFHCHEEMQADVIIQYIPKTKALFEHSSLA